MKQHKLKAVVTYWTPTSATLRLFCERCGEYETSTIEITEELLKECPA
jgi:hypothetical protein